MAVVSEPATAENIVVNVALDAEGIRCVRMLLIASDGSRMAADLTPEDAQILADMAIGAAQGPGLQQRRMILGELEGQSACLPL